MAPNQAKRGNAIAQASLNESQRQYNEQKAEENQKKATAKANAGAVRSADNMAYSNFFTGSNNLQGGTGNFSLVNTNGGTPSVIGGLAGLDSNTNTTLGG